MYNKVIGAGLASQCVNAVNREEKFLLAPASSAYPGLSGLFLAGGYLWRAVCPGLRPKVRRNFWTALAATTLKYLLMRGERFDRQVGLPSCSLST